jgi:hypothetical protein
MSWSWDFDRSLFLGEIGYYSQPEPLVGQEVPDKYPRMQVDVEEAGKCLVLN